jgi:hypothetical protein
MTTPEMTLYRIKDNTIIRPLDNTIDISKLDICESCQSKFIAAFIKTYQGNNDDNTSNDLTKN